MKAHVVGIVHFPIGRVFQEEAFKPQNLKQERPLLGSEGLGLEFVNVAIANNVFEDDIELVEDFDPRIEV